MKITAIRRRARVRIMNNFLTLLYKIWAASNQTKRDYFVLNLKDDNSHVEIRLESTIPLI